MPINPNSLAADPELLEICTIVLQLAESKWIHRAWKWHKLTEKQKTAIRKLSARINSNF
jgi:hypothetical protein